jgi:hypothetical protein
MFRRAKVANAALVISILALVAAVVGTAMAGPDQPIAETSASSKRIALSALKQAKRARKAARAARMAAKAARATASQAQASADTAQTAAGQAQGAAASAQTTASQTQVLAAQATIGRSAYSLTCDPTSTIVFLDCVGTTLALPRSGRVLLSATGGQASGGVPTHGLCRLEVDDSTGAIPHPAALRPGEVVTDNTDGSAQNGFAITAVTNVLPAGQHKFEMSCNEEIGDLAVLHSMITAVMIGAG